MSATMTAVARDAHPQPRARLRNRMRVVLDAPVDRVWALVGDLARLPAFSAGLERVDVKAGAQGQPVEITCHFKPHRQGEAGIVSRDRVTWYQPGLGWASTASEEPDAWGIRDSLHRVTVEPSGRGTLVIWIAHYNADDRDAFAAYSASLDEAYADIAERLIVRFGGRVLERSADSSAA